MLVRRLRGNECRKILGLMRRIYPAEFSDKMLLEWCMKSGSYPFVRWFAGEHKGKIAGFTRWHLADAAGRELILELSWTAVAKEHERKGIASEIVKKSFRDVNRYWMQKGFKVSGIWVQTDIKNNKARKFYKKVMSELGFKPHELPARKMWKKDSIIFISARKRNDIKRNDIMSACRPALL